MTGPAQLADAAWLKQDEIAGLLSLLNKAGEEARVVGGAVRNTLLHMPVAEIDIATTAEPHEVVRRVEAAGWKTVPTGIEHGTVTVVISSHPFEVTTLRQDVETFGRKARVKFGRDWRADAERRDFTMNALSASADGKVFDYVGGLDDIAARRVRFIGEPQQRIAEDYLRILRFFRFHAYFAEGAPDAAGLHACIVAPRWPRHFIARALAHGIAQAFYRVSRRADAHRHGRKRPAGSSARRRAVCREFCEARRDRNGRWQRADPVRRLGALGVMVREDAERLSQRLRLSNAEFERLAALDGWWLISPSLSEQAAHALLYQLGPQSFADRVLHRLGAGRRRRG